MKSPLHAAAQWFRKARSAKSDSSPRVSPRVSPRRGSILILVIAVLLLLVIIGTAALSTNTSDRYATQQNNFNTQVDLLLEGVKKQAEAVIVGDIIDSGVQPPYSKYRPGAGTPGAKYNHWDMPLLFSPNSPPAGMDPLTVQGMATSNDAWLSPRYPSVLFPANVGNTPIPPLAVDATNNPPVWDAIGAPLELPNGLDTNQALYNSPMVGTVSTASGIYTSGTAYLASGLPSDYSWRTTNRYGFNHYDGTTTQTFGADAVVLRPGSIGTATINGTSITYDPPLPSWTLPNPTNPNQYLKVVAGDADGDGIADSALRKINVGEINGLTYYYACRIIDNGSAINVNTAWSRDHEFLGNGTGEFAMSSRNGVVVPQATGFFPSNIGLFELLKQNASGNSYASLNDMETKSADMAGIDNYRFNGYTTVNSGVPIGVITDQTTGATSGGPFVDMPPGSASTVTQPNRTDFVYNTLGELLYFGLTKRVGNPGVLAQAGGADIRFQPFTVSDSAALAYKFTLQNPNASRSTLESAATLSLTGLTIPYKATDSLKWFTDNFNYESEFTGTYTEAAGSYLPRRAMFTATDPVANVIPTISTGAATTGNVKVSVNTGTGTDLQQAFLSVMTEGNAQSPYEVPGTSANASQPIPLPTAMYAFAGMRFNQPVETVLPSSGTASTAQDYTLFYPKIDTNPERMFRNSLRDNTTMPDDIGSSTVFYDDVNNKLTPAAGTDSSRAVQFTPQTMRQLRSYLATVNTLSMRSPQRNTPVPTKITLPASGTSANVDVYMYPVEQQPYITEIYANTDTVRKASDYHPEDAAAPTTINIQPYVAVELFFPYAVPGTSNATSYDLTNWQLAVIDRSRTAANKTFASVHVIHTFKPGDNAVFPSTTAGRGNSGSYMLLENFSATAGTGQVTYRPKSSGLLYTVDYNTAANHPATAPPLIDVYVPELAYVVGGGYTGSNNTGGALPAQMTGVELVLLKPNTSGAPAPSKPIDSFDFTGLINDSTSNSVGHTWHYSRIGQRSTAPNVDAHQLWGMVYPGRYDGGLPSRRQEGTQAGKYSLAMPVLPDTYDTDGYFDPFDTSITPSTAKPLNPGCTLGDANTGGGDNASLYASFSHTETIQVMNTDQPGWNQVADPSVTGKPNAFPFGGFARNSDILQIPYFGSYVVLTAGTALETTVQTTGVVEMNSLPMDVAYCEDTDPFDDDPPTPTALMPAMHRATYEQVGRFCPLDTVVTPDFANYTLTEQMLQVAVDDMDPLPENFFRYHHTDTPPPNTYAITHKEWRYHWATRLFDYLTVQDPQSDFLPNVHPDDYKPVTVVTPAFQPVPVSNDGGTPGVGNGETIPPYTPFVPYSAGAENNVPLHGLININTASWRVLSSINWTPYPPGTDQFKLQPRTTPADGQYEFAQSVAADGIDDNVEIAKAIVWWRDGITDPAGGAPPAGPKGPFRSIYDLMRVPALTSYYTLLAQQRDAVTNHFDDADGDYSPFNLTATTPNPTTDGVSNDFEERFLALNRVSNLITTRSDSFTVYIVVQGWRNAGSTNLSNPPQLVVQKRAAFIADRSKITAPGVPLSIVPIPTE